VPPPEDAVAVVGATSLVGHDLLPRLAAAGRVVHAISRRPPSTADGAARWHVVDVARAPGAIPAVTAAVHLAPLWLAPPVVESLAARGLRRLVAFSSTSRFTKAGSSDRREQDVARRLAEAEDAVAAACARGGVAWTILRPTLIYGGGRDANLTAIARVARRLGVVAVAGRGEGRRQPVHADDLAAACVRLLDAPETHGRAYDVGGGTVLAYRDMVAEVCRAAGGARVIAVPPGLLRAAFRIAGLVLPVSGAMVDRMERDLVADDAAARRDFGWAPRAFAYPDGAPRP
jgi:nucleoside-diphosphate-sugar epimerase